MPAPNGGRCHPDHPAGGTARLLRRRRSRHQDRRIGAAEVRAPVYVRHEIVHNRHVVDDLKAKGAIFVEELDEIPETDAPVIFSAHGVPQSVPAAAKARKLFYVDATCPLVSKVHVEARAQHAKGLRDRPHRPRRPSRSGGHAGPAARRGRNPDRDRRRMPGASTARSGTARLHHADHPLRRRHGGDRGHPARALPRHRRPAQGRHLLRHDQPAGRRQGDRRAVAMPAGGRLTQQLQLAAPGRGGRRAGCAQARLVQSASDLVWSEFAGVRTLGVTAGASAPEAVGQPSRQRLPRAF